MIWWPFCFQNKDTITLRQAFFSQAVSKVPNIELGDLITTKELGETLKTMKHNKSPGMDGFTTRIFKGFLV